MEDLDSSNNVPPSVETPATTESAASQPTYTTAGTPYKPRSSQPLQPPTRRGRLFKWSSGFHSGMSLLPKSALPGLFANGGCNTSSTLQHYTPLQQNNDRAINPSGSSEIFCANMGTAAPGDPAATTPTSLTGLFPDLEQRKRVQPDSDDSSDESEEDDFSMNHLMMMPVKSLQNLASYPNPNQKRAQKALLRGTRPTLKVLPAPTFDNGASGSAARSSARALDSNMNQRENSMPPAFRSGPDMHGSVNRLNHPIDVYVSEYQRQVARTSRERSNPGLNGHNNGHVFDTPASMTLASGPGAPQPLTAGPPGHRQLYRSRFEPNLNAVQTKQANHAAYENMHVFTVSRHTLRQAGIEDLSSWSDESASPFTITDLGSPDGYSTTMTTVGSVGTMLSPEQEAELAQAYGSLASREATYMYTPTRPAPTKVALTPAVLGVRYIPGTDRMTEGSVQRRMRKINQAWYAGADFMAKTSDELVDEYRARSHGRLDGEAQVATKHKDQYRPLELGEGTRVSAAEHARPLINMAMANLQVYQEPSKPKRGPAFWPLE